jgi:hypothetical protein
MLFEGFCIFGFWEFFKNFFCILMEVNKTMNGNNDDVPNKLFDNLYPESDLCDVTFAVVWNILAADENKSVNRPSMNQTWSSFLMWLFVHGTSTKMHSETAPRLNHFISSWSRTF